METQCVDKIDASETMVLSIAGTQILRFDLICRICGNENEKNISIYGPDGLTNELALKINTYLPIKVSEQDSLPLNCCYTCTSTVLTWHELVVNSVEADRKLKEIPVVVNNPVVENEEIVKDEPEIILPADCYTILAESTIGPGGRKKKRQRKARNNKDRNRGYHKRGRGYRRRELIDGVPIYTCKHCFDTFPIANDLWDHLETHGDVRRTMRTRSRDIEKKVKFFCGVCGKGFTRQHDMARHWATKHPEHAPETYLCPIGKLDLSRAMPEPPTPPPVESESDSD